MSKPNINVLIGGPKNKHSYTYKEVILKENFPLSQQMVEKNRKYVVKWNFDLNGETVTVPENSILEFDGGTLHNGTLISDDTEIIGKLPKNMNTLYGQYYRDKKPINYNMMVTKPVNTCVDFAFMTPADFVSYRFYPQDIAVFYYNDNKYHLTTGNIEGTNPERQFMLLFDENYDYLGSTEIALVGHGGALAVCEGKLYMGCTYNPESEYPDKYGIAVYPLSNIVTTCINEGSAIHNDIYTNKIQCESFIQPHYDNETFNCIGLDYDAVNEEFAISDGDNWIHILDKNFNHKRTFDLNIGQYLTDKTHFGGWIQGIVLKNGIIYGNFWTSDYPDADRGSNIFFNYDTIKGKMVNFEKMSTPYQDGECEGFFKNPDDDNEIYFLIGANQENGSTVIGVCKVSQVNALYGLDTKRENRAGLVNSLRYNFIYVDKNYDFSSGRSNGSSLRPFKTIGSAIAVAYAEGSEFIILVAGRNVESEYILPPIKVGKQQTFSILGYRKDVEPEDWVKPTINGYIQAYGGNVRLTNIKLIPNKENAVYCSNAGFLFLDNVEIAGENTIATNGVKITDNSKLKIEGTTIIHGFSSCGIFCNWSDAKGVIELRNCGIGFLVLYSTFGFTNAVIEGCDTGIQSRRTNINLGVCSFSNVTTCFDIDDHIINTWAPRSITLNNVTNVVLKDPDARGRVNIMCKADTSEEATDFFNFVKSGTFNSTGVGLRVNSSGVVYNGMVLEKGVYVYNNPNFYEENNPYIRFIEDNNEFVYVPTSGTIEQRPNLTSDFKGFQYFDTTLNIPIYWDGSKWVESDIDAVSGVWQKLGVLTSESQTFGDYPVSVIKQTRTSDWIGWTEAQNNTIYITWFKFTGSPITDGDVIKIVIEYDGNIECHARYGNDSDSEIESITGGNYNKKKIIVLSPTKKYPNLTLWVACDKGQFNGTIEVYKKIA